MPKGTETRIEQGAVDEGIGKLRSWYPENLLYGQWFELHSEKKLLFRGLELYRHGVETVDKTIRHTVLLAADLRNKGKFVVQVENDLHDAFGYDRFLVQRGAALGLPNRLDGMAERRGVRYGKAVVQMSGQFSAVL